MKRHRGGPDAKRSCGASATNRWSTYGFSVSPSRVYISTVCIQQGPGTLYWGKNMTRLTVLSSVEYHYPCPRAQYSCLGERKAPFFLWYRGISVYYRCIGVLRPMVGTPPPSFPNTAVSNPCCIRVVSIYVCDGLTIFSGSRLSNQ